MASGAEAGDGENSRLVAPRRRRRIITVGKATVGQGCQMNGSIWELERVLGRRIDSVLLCV